MTKKSKKKDKKRRRGEEDGGEREDILDEKVAKMREEEQGRLHMQFNAYFILLPLTIEIVHVLNSIAQNENNHLQL